MPSACLSPSCHPITSIDTIASSTSMLTDSAMTRADDDNVSSFVLALQLSEAQSSLAACKLTIHAQQEQLEMHNEERELHHTQLSVLRVSDMHPERSTAWRSS